MSVGADGRREQSAGGLSRALRDVLSELCRELGPSWARIGGIGLAAQGGSMAIVDRETGRPRTPLVLWNDARAFRHLGRVTAGRPPAWWRAFSLRDEPGMGLARLEWVRETRPELLVPGNLYAGAGEILYHALTGAWRQDACNAHQIGCYDAVRHELTPKPLRGTGVPLSFFAPLREGHATRPLAPRLARETGLREGIPVAGPYMDHEAGYLSVATTSRRPLQCSLGTAWVGNFVVPERSSCGSPSWLPIPSPAGPGRLVIQPLLTGNVTWDWALETWVDPDRGRALARQDEIFRESLLPPRGLVAIPWLNRPNPLETAANGAGCLLGVSPATTREDLLRATAAGMTCELARVLDAVKSRRRVSALILSGGASKGEHFRRLLSALFAPLPCFRVTEEDSMGARGCLHAFGGPASRARVARAEAPRARDARDILDGYATYLRAFDRLLGGVPAGRPFRFGERTSTSTRGGETRT